MRVSGRHQTEKIMCVKSQRCEKAAGHVSSTIRSWNQWTLKSDIRSGWS